MFSRSSFLPAVGVACLLAAAPASVTAAPVTRTSSVSVNLLSANSLIKLDDLDFGTITATTAGTAVMNPVTNLLSTTGGVLSVGGNPQPARFEGAAAKNSTVNIKLPKTAVTLTRVGGTQTVSLSNFTMDGPTKKQMAQSTSFVIRVGATLTVPAAQLPGLYTGTFVVTAQYP